MRATSPQLNNRLILRNIIDYKDLDELLHSATVFADEWIKERIFRGIGGVARSMGSRLRPRNTSRQQARGQRWRYGFFS
jgi:hypothetical protein